METCETNPNRRHMTRADLERRLADRSTLDLDGYCLHGELLCQIGDLRSVDFGGAVLRGADMSCCDLRKSSFRGCDMQDTVLFDADLTEADLSGADLRNADLETANLTDALLEGTRLQGANLRDVRLSRTRIQRESLGKAVAEETRGIDHFFEAHDIYLRLKENFQSIGAYDAAGWAYLRERTLQRRSYCPSNAVTVYGPHEDYSGASMLRRLRFRLKYLLKYAGAWLQELTWGYGQKPQRVVLVCGIVVVGFALVYGAAGGLSSSGSSALGYRDLVVYSLAAFAISSVPDVEPVTRLAQALTSLEGILGVATLALLTAALARRMGGR